MTITTSFILLGGSAIARDKSFAYQADYSYYGIQPVAPRIGFQFHHEVLKASNLDTFKEYLDQTDYVSIDTETTGLEFDIADLVTVQISLRVDMEIKSYIAYFHSGYVTSVFKGKLDKLPSRIEILRLVKKALTKKFCVFHNRPYDESIFIYAPNHITMYNTPFFDKDNRESGCPEVKNPLSEVDFYGAYDNYALWFQMDSNCLSGLSIKDLGPTYLGINMEHFDEKVGEDILTSNPKTLLDYGCLDTYVTLSLFLLAYPRYASKAPLLAKLLPQFTTALYSFEQHHQHVDVSKCKILYDEVTQKLEDVKSEFYANYGVINLGSSLQKSRVLISLGYTTGEYAKPRPDGEQVLSLKKGLMEKLVKQGCHPAELMLKYNKLVKLQSSYAKVLLNFCSPQEDGSVNQVRFHFHENRAPCLTKGSTVVIRGKGLIDVSEVREHDFIWTMFGWKEVTWCSEHQADKVYKITLQNGTSLTGTGYHPVLVSKTKTPFNTSELEWAGLQDLKEGELVCINSHPVEGNWRTSLPKPRLRDGLRATDIAKIEKKRISIPSVMTPELARWMGFIDGDGCIASDGIVLCFSEYETEILDYYWNLTEDLFKISLGGRPRPRKDHTIQKKVCSVVLRDWCEELNLRQHKFDSVSEWIMHAEPSCWIAYLQGLWDSDGYVKKMRYLKSLGKDLYAPGVKLVHSGQMRDVFQMMQALGIKSRIHDCLWYEKQGQRKQTEISISEYSGVDQFRKVIGRGLVSNKKRERSCQEYNKAYHEMNMSPVISVEELTGETVYSFEVADIHHFVANGIYTHNTLRLACGKYTINRRGYNYYLPMNAQALPKPHSIIRGLDYNPETYEVKFYPDAGTDLEPKGKFCVETGDDNMNFRGCFTAPEGYVMVKCDFCLTLDTLIKTTKGDVPLGDLIGKEVEVLTPLGPRLAKNIRLTGKHKQYKFKLESGAEIVCSPEHKLAIERDGKYMWEEACKIRLTDSILEYEQIDNRITWDFK